MRRWMKAIPTVVLLVLTQTAHAVPLTIDLASRTINFAQGTPTTSGLKDNMDVYQIGGRLGTAVLATFDDANPRDPVYRRSVSENFASALSTAFPTSAGWSYVSSANPLSDNSLVVRTYDVQGTAGRVGAEFHLEYVPHGNDPTTDVHWIQVITNNHALPQDVHGVVDNKVDTTSLTSPYYDTGYAATAREFYDFPGRNDAQNNHRWLAELFLVTGPAAGTPGQITFWGGVSWGWENQVPEPGTAALLVVALSAAMCAGRARRTRALDRGSPARACG